MTHLLLTNCQNNFLSEHYQSEETKSLFGGRYTLTTQKYNRDYTHNIIRKDTTELFVIQNCYRLAYSEFSKNGIDYLLVNRYKSPMILDLTNQKTYPISGCISLSNARLSPSGTTLYASGNDGYDSFGVFYDFTDPSNIKHLPLQTEETLTPCGNNEIHDVFEDEFTDVQWGIGTDGQECCIWTQMAVYYTDLKMKSSEAYSHFQKVLNFDQLNSSEPLFSEKHTVLFNQLKDLLRKEQRQINVDRVVSLKRMGDSIFQTHSWKSQSMIDDENENTACWKYRDSVNKLWKEGCKFWKLAALGKETHQTWSKDCHCLVIQCGLSEVRFHTGQNNIKHSTAWIVKHFGKNTTPELVNEAENEIRQQLDYSGPIEIYKNSQLVKKFDSMNNLTWGDLMNAI